MKHGLKHSDLAYHSADCSMETLKTVVVRLCAAIGLVAVFMYFTKFVDFMKRMLGNMGNMATVAHVAHESTR